MNDNLSTCWTLIRGAAHGDSVSTEELVRRYSMVIRGYLQNRWQTTPIAQHLEDACQETFFELFRDQGALQKVDTSGNRPFRSFLFGVVSNVARRIEQKYARSKTYANTEIDVQQPDAESASHLFDRLWAQAIVAQAVTEMRRRAAEQGGVLQLRVELLHLRFFDELPIREIAEKLGIAAAKAHKEYASARNDFRRILREVIAFHNPGNPQAAAAELKEIAAFL